MPKVPQKKTKKKGKVEAPQIHCVWGLVCTNVSEDKTSNNFSLFNIVEELHLPPEFFLQDSNAHPAYYPHELVTLWRRVISTDLNDDAIENDIVIELIDPVGSALFRIIHKIEIPEGKERVRYRIHLNQIPPLTRTGTYLYRLSYKPIAQEEFKSHYDIPIQVDDKPTSVPS